MYPTLYHLFQDLFGVEWTLFKAIPMFGFWVGMAFLVASWLGGKELKRREKLGYLSPQKKTITIGEPANLADYIGNGVIGFILGFKLIYLITNSSVVDDFPGFILSRTGSIIGGVLGLVALVGWKYYESKKQTLAEPYKKEINFHSHEHMGNITMISVVSGILGAVIFGFLEQPSKLYSEFIEDDYNIEKLYGGLTVYGGVILAVIANIYYFWKNKLNFRQYLDALGPTVLLAYGIGRIGCQMAGDGDWGIVNTDPKPDWMSFLPDWLWAYDYPNNVNETAIPFDGYNGYFSETNEQRQFLRQLWNENHKLIVPVYPTPLYEVIMSTILFAGIWSIRKIVKIPLMIFSLYLLATGVERYLIEQIRVNTGHDTGLTQAEMISIGLIITAIGLGIFSYLQFKKKA